MRDRVSKGWVCVCLRVQRIDAIIHLFFFFGTSKMICLRHQEPRTDIWSGICTRLTADTKYHCASASFLTVCVMSKLQYLIWTTCRKLNPITGLRLALKSKAVHSNHVFADHALCKSSACDYELLHVCIWLYEGKTYRKVSHQRTFTLAWQRPFYCRKINHLLQNMWVKTE